MILFVSFPRLADAGMPKDKKKRQPQDADAVPLKYLYTLADVGRLTNASRAYLYKDIRSGKLKTVMFAGKRQVRPQDLQDYLRSL